ncbi:hypothetical protein BGP_1097 [Beggiatoa sp. PS]|nr:hypothetical protein BGP_1097 [Beggiatoa sp. PS]
MLFLKEIVFVETSKKNVFSRILFTAISPNCALESKIYFGGVQSFSFGLLAL